eukprot:g5852.t1
MDEYLTYHERSMLTISLTPLIDSDLHVFPVFLAPLSKTLSKTFQTIKFLILGWGGAGKNQEDVLNLLNAVVQRNLSISVTIISKGKGASRELHKKIFENQNFSAIIRWKEAIPANLIYKAVEKHHFVLPMIGQGGYRTMRMAGCIPIAIGTAVPMIIDSELGEKYNLKDNETALFYKVSVVESLDKVMQMKEREYVRMRERIGRVAAKNYERNRKRLQLE